MSTVAEIMRAELSAMEAIVAALDPLDEHQRRRVLNWARDRYVDTPFAKDLLETLKKQPPPPPPAGVPQRRYPG
ncbi:hypothetical protein [Limnoglobus roseus]|uniref:Uncharacterized protein n=1 Tax=Limnoglobus roseus TaxID=2598579 RepID=A0A5C1AGF8_9BACT|nr:hypothetical protein [Limnoglobus roseus]QEL18509.1 hypothetical protein PX52LOC_05535 [Limnoglobus roseus]